MPNSTTNYSFNKPLVADPIDADLWGGFLNDNWDSADTLIKSVSDVANAASSYVDYGDIKITSRTSAPSLWLFCGGQAISRTTYSDLFSAIGTTYGSGDGSTTFNVPDLKGRVIVGKDDMGGTAANRITSGVSGIAGTTLGASGGDQRMQQHNHGVTDPGHFHTRAFASAGIAGFAAGAGGSLFSNATNVPTSTNTTGITVNNEGAGSSQNVQPSIILNYLIYAGV